MNRRHSILLLSCLTSLVIFIFPGKSQEVVPVVDLTQIADTIDTQMADTIHFAQADSLTQAVLQKADSIPLPSAEDMNLVTPFKPNPNKALLYSAIVPGLGQIYNRKYWKLPILYGGLMGCAYAITWNNKNYSDYSQAYWAVTRDGTGPIEHLSDWKAFVQDASMDWSDEDAVLAKAQNSTFQSQLKRKKDYFRRYRDMSIFIAVGVYVLGMLDAYVDAHLFDFDISPDLSMRVQPAVTPGNQLSPHIYGINCSLNF